MRVSSCCLKTLLFFRFSFCQHKHSWNSSRCLDKNITFCRRTRSWICPDTSSKPPNAAGKRPGPSLKVSSGVWKQERRSLFLAWLKCHHRPPPPADMKGSSYWQQGWRWSDWSTCRHEESRPKNIWFLSCPRELQRRGRKLRFKFADTCKDPGESAAPTGRAIHFFLQNFQKNPSVRSAFEWCEITVCSIESASFVAHETCKLKIPWKKTFVRREAAEAPGAISRSTFSPAFSKNTPQGCKESVTHQETLFLSHKLLINMFFT